MRDFKEDASNRPNIHGGVVHLRSQQHLGSTVPQGDNFVSVLLRWEFKHPSQSKISQFYPQRVSLNENVLRFEVAVDDPVGVTILQRKQQLVYDSLYAFLGKGDPLHVPLEVAVHKIKNQLQLILPRDHLPQSHNIGMRKRLQQRDFPNRSRGQSFIFVIEPYLLDCHDIVGEFVASLVDHSVSALSDLVDTLVTLHLVPA